MAKAISIFALRTTSFFVPSAFFCIGQRITLIKDYLSFQYIYKRKKSIPKAIKYQPQIEINS